MFRIFTLIALGLVVGCNGNKDENPDVDGDGYKASKDCNDQDANINPDAVEMCDGIDNNCDDEVDDSSAEDAQTWYADSDEDGYGDDDNVVVSCDQPTDYIETAGDCDDTSTDYYPGAPEEDCTDPNDYNCDGSTGYEDADGDGYPACEDCDDAEATANDGMDETCGDGIDNNCDTLIDDPTSVDASTWYIDYDGDGFGSSTVEITECEQRTGFVADNSDCDDLHADAYPDNPDTPEPDAAPELCDGYDNDCDGTADEADAQDVTVWFADTDADGFGDVLSNTAECDQPSGYVDNGDDCDDTTAAVNPDADEYCNSIDDDCDTEIDEDSALDTTAWYIDYDSDGYGDFLGALYACSQPGGYADNYADCNDDVPGINPGATEVCNGIDDDCVNGVDIGAIDASTWYQDSDGDGYGNSTVFQSACTQPFGWVELAMAGDCDDADSSVSPGATEVCNDGIDNDCDGSQGECSLSLSDADTVFSGNASSEFGSGITAGDINGDTYMDIAVGAPLDNANDGAVYVFYGPISDASLTTADADVTILGSGGRKIGSALDAGSDIDGDLNDDLLIATKKYAGSQGSNQGAARVFLGPIANGTYYVDEADLHLTGEAVSDYAGQTIDYPGDVNNDGYPDILVGADGWDDITDGGTLDRNGAAYIVYGPVSAANSSTGELSLADSSVTQFTGTHTDEGLAKAFNPARDSLVGAGDINGDGIPDIAMGAANSDRFNTDAGAVYLVHGVDSTTGGSFAGGTVENADTILTGSSANEKAGLSVAPAGDQDGDGYDELLVGAQGTNTVYVVQGSASGIADGELANVSLATITPTLSSGLHTTAGGGDVNNDGQLDILVGAYSDNSNTGTAYLFTGPLSGALSESDAAGTFEGVNLSSKAGVSLSFAGDVNGTNTGDGLLIGASGSGSDEVYLMLSIGQ